MLLDDFYRIALRGTAKETQHCVQTLTAQTQNSDQVRGKLLIMLANMGDQLMVRYMDNLNELTAIQNSGQKTSKTLDLHGLYKGAYCLQTAYTLSAKGTGFQQSVGEAFKKASLIVKDIESFAPNFSPLIPIREFKPTTPA